MTRRIVTAVVMLPVLCGLAFAQNRAAHAGDEAAIRAIMTSLADAWTRGDGVDFAKSFATDADFRVWNGFFLKGRDAIAGGHAHIFSTMYKDTKMSLNVRSIRFLRDDVAVVHTEGNVVSKSESFPARPDAVPVFILTKDKGQWQIAVFQNTKIAPGQPANQ